MSTILEKRKIPIDLLCELIASRYKFTIENGIEQNEIPSFIRDIIEDLLNINAITTQAIDLSFDTYLDQ